MFVTPSIRETPTDTAGVFAFHIIGEVSSDDMIALAETMNDRFDAHEKVSMLLIFDRYEGAERGANLDWTVIKSRLRSVVNIDKYVLVNAPQGAARMVETFGKLLPVDAMSFDDEDAAWEFVGARALDQQITH